MYHSRTNKSGVSRDHMFSISDGYKLKIDPAIISHPANCQIILQADNSKKNAKSSISLNQLMERIHNWDSIE